MLGKSEAEPAIDLFRGRFFFVGRLGVRYHSFFVLQGEQAIVKSQGFRTMNGDSPYMSHWKNRPNGARCMDIDFHPLPMAMVEEKVVAGPNGVGDMTAGSGIIRALQWFGAMLLVVVLGLVASIVTAGQSVSTQASLSSPVSVEASSPAIVPTPGAIATGTKEPADGSFGFFGSGETAIADASVLWTWSDDSESLNEVLGEDFSDDEAYEEEDLLPPSPTPTKVKPTATRASRSTATATKAPTTGASNGISPTSSPSVGTPSTSVSPVAGSPTQQATTIPGTPTATPTPKL